MSVEEKKVEAQTEKKPAGDDAVVLLGKKLEEYGKKLDGAITKMESIEQELGKVKVAKKEVKKETKRDEDEEAKKKDEDDEDEAKKKDDDDCPEWAKEIGKKLDDLLKVKKEEVKKDEDDDEDEDEAKKKVKKSEAKKKQPEEEEEEDEPWEDEDDAEAKKKVKGAKVEDGESVKGAVTGSWYDEIKAASKKYFPDI